MRSEEVVLVTLTGIDVAHHHEESRMLDEHIGGGIDDRVVAHLHIVSTIALYDILSHIWRIVGSLIASEIASVGTEVDIEHLSYTELDVEVRIDIKVWYWYHLLLARVLVGNYVLPVEDAQTEVLHELSCQDVDRTATLHRSDTDTCSQTSLCHIVTL